MPTMAVGEVGTRSSASFVRPLGMSAELLQGLCGMHVSGASPEMNEGHEDDRPAL